VLHGRAVQVEGRVKPMHFVLAVVDVGRPASRALQKSILDMTITPEQDLR